MITGIGVDIIEKVRVAKAVSRWGERFLDRLFTENELQDCHRKSDRVGSLAARFAAKEAMFKALGTGWSEGIGWKDIEILTRSGGHPEMVCHARASDLMQGKRAVLSLSHDKRSAIALVIIESMGG
jgi:holo-[acyl-carrier protein] synthase